MSKRDFRVETVQSLKSKWPWPLTSKSTEVFLGSRLIHVWRIIIICQKEMELSSRNGKTNGKKLKVRIWSWPLTYWPQIDRGPSHVMVNTSVKYHCCMPKNKWSYHVERYKVQRPNMTLSFNPLTPKSIEVLLSSRSIHLWSIIIVCEKQM